MYTKQIVANPLVLKIRVGRPRIICLFGFVRTIYRKTINFSLFFIIRIHSPKNIKVVITFIDVISSQ